MRRYFTSWLLTVLVVIFLERTGQYFDLFQYHSLGYDKLLHFLAGISCGIFGIALYDSELIYGLFGVWDPLVARKKWNKRMWIAALVAAFVIGVLWEVLQVYFPFFRDASDYDWLDTLGDVVFDVAGGIVTALVYQKKDRSA